MRGSEAQFPDLLLPLPQLVLPLLDFLVKRLTRGGGARLLNGSGVRTLPDESECVPLSLYLYLYLVEISLRKHVSN